LETTHECFINTHKGAGIVEFATVVGCRKESNKLTRGEKLVTIFDDLMSTANEIEILTFEKAVNDVGTKSVRNSTVILAPSVNVLFRIRPEQITEQASVGNVSRSNYPTNLFHGF